MQTAVPVPWQQSRLKNGEKYKLPECGFVPAKGKRFTVWDKGAVGTELTVTADVVVKARWEDTIFDYKEVTISENKVLTTKDADGKEIALKIEYTGVVSYNGLSHVSQLNKANKSVVQDVKVDLKCSLSEYATPVITFKNNKSAIVKKAGKEPAFTISFKAKKGATKAQKKVIKAVNKELKKTSFKFALNPMDIGSADKATVKLNKKQTKVTKLILEKGGKKFKLSSKDYSYVINADGSVKITAKEKRNYCGERTVKP